MASGASHRFEDNVSDVDSVNLNTLDQGGNVYASPNGGLKVRITAIRGLINNVEIDYAGAPTDQTMTDSATNYLWIDDAGLLQVNTTGFPVYPGTKYFPLATVVCAAAAIVSIIDKRWKFFA